MVQVSSLSKEMSVSTGSQRVLLRCAAALTVALVLAALLVSPRAASAEIVDGTRFYVPEPNHDGVKQVLRLARQGRFADARRVHKMLRTPTAVWVETGSPRDARRQVQQVTKEAAARRTVPVLVLYNIPFRDCAQYSAGGATSVAEYKAWIDGVVRGIGRHEVGDRRSSPTAWGSSPGTPTSTAPRSGASRPKRTRHRCGISGSTMLNYAVDRLSSLAEHVGLP